MRHKYYVPVQKRRMDPFGEDGLPHQTISKHFYFLFFLQLTEA